MCSSTALARALLEHETLDEDAAYVAAGVVRPREDAVGGLSVAAADARSGGV